MNNENTELAVVAETSKDLAAPSLMSMMAEYAGAGLENVTEDAMALPLLRMLQAKSPEVENDPDTYKPGMLVHSITGKIYNIREKDGKPLKFVQAHFNKQIVEWGDKEAGNGGLKARHACTAQALAVLEALPRNEKKKPLAPVNGKAPFPPAQAEGNTLEETAYHYVILIDDSGLEVAVLPLKSTGLTPSKRLMRMIDSAVISVPGSKPFAAPSFANVYSIQSFLDKQKTGAQNTFMNVRFTKVGPLEDETTFNTAVGFYQSVKANKVKVDEETLPEDHSSAPDPADQGHDTPDDDSAPF